MSEKIKEGADMLKTTETTINGETVWYSNNVKNFLLKLKRFFIKPKHNIDTSKYKKIVNSSLYGKFSGNEFKTYN
ncbi:MAG: hypothetical protein RBT65_19205 [Methanolobus sp.]|nr:hypothetical protein [Methanolobus sp.]